MSIHSSLKSSKSGGGNRNVWTRVERLAALKKAGRWQDGQRVEGLPKVRTSFKAKGAKKKKEEAPADGKAAAGKPAAGKPAAGKAAAPKK